MTKKIEEAKVVETVTYDGRLTNNGAQALREHLESKLRFKEKEIIIATDMSSGRKKRIVTLINVKTNMCVDIDGRSGSVAIYAPGASMAHVAHNTNLLNIAVFEAVLKGIPKPKRPAVTGNKR